MYLIHLEYDQSNSKKFLFIEYELMTLLENDDLVLWVDILEFWRGKNIDAIFSNYNTDDKNIDEQIFLRII